MIELDGFGLDMGGGVISLMVRVVVDLGWGKGDAEGEGD